MASEKPREIVKRCMPNVRNEHVDGIMYLKGISPFMPSEALKKMSQLVLHPDDVFFNGWPRSGYHWTSYALDMILKQSATPTSRALMEAVLDVFTDEQFNKFNATPVPRLFASYFWIQRLPDIAKKNTRVVYLIRNPKDAFVSFYKLMSLFSKEFRFNGTWDEFFEATIGGEMVYGPWFEHVLAFEKFMADNPNVPVYILQFEEMEQKPVDCIKKLCAFLGKPDTLAEEIAAKTSMEEIDVAIKRHSEANKKWFDDTAEPKFIDKGEKTGLWKNHFTVAQNERFDEIFENKMKGSKLAELVRQDL